MRTKLNPMLACILVAIGIIATSQIAQAITYKQLYGRPEARGFYYCLDMANYPHILQSNMPYRVLQGYIIADSVVRFMPHLTSYRIDPIQALNLLSDTAQYIYKYWYIMNEYDPKWFYAFINRKYNDARNTPSSLQYEMRPKLHFHPKGVYVLSDYILHVRVNSTVWIDTANTDTPDNWSRTIAFCEILDTLKGGTFPSLDDAIFYNGEQQKQDGNKIESAYSIPQATDIVFSYIDQWDRYYDMISLSAGWLFDSNGDHWIKPKREYIVFLEQWGQSGEGSYWPIGSVHKEYYDLSPYPGEGSYNMYPVEDGFVVDESNALGFGEKVPVDIFKQNIQAKINEIKHYGE